jgi:Domain of unkown function (DUF1775)
MTVQPTTLRRFVVVAASAAALSFVAPAVSGWADVTVTPAQAMQGDSAGVTFRVRNDSRASLSRVTVYLPEATPIEEVYPYSVPGWAPKVSMRKVDARSKVAARLRTSEVVSAVEWRAAPGTAPGPGKVVELPLSLNPIPVVDRLVFSVAVTHSDGTVVRWGESEAAGVAKSPNPGPTITVIPRAAREDRAEGRAPGAAADRTNVPAGPPPAWVAGFLLLALSAVAAVLVFRRRMASDASPADARDPVHPAGSLPAPTSQDAQQHEQSPVTQHR